MALSIRSRVYFGLLFIALGAAGFYGVHLLGLPADPQMIKRVLASPYVTRGTVFVFVAAVVVSGAMSVGGLRFLVGAARLAVQSRSRKATGIGAKEHAVFLNRYRKAPRGKAPEAVSHWHHRADDFNMSAVAFYDAVRTELEIAKAPVTFARVEWQEGGVHTAMRVYMRIEFNRMVFDLCAAPFGKAFFFSWWLGERPASFASLFGCLGLLAVPAVLTFSYYAVGILEGIVLSAVILGVGWAVLASMINSGATGIEDALIATPVMGRIYIRLFRPTTYYAVDSRLVFEETVHGIVLSIVDAMLTARGAKALAPEERKLQSRSVIR